jgi:hypothetical protein
MAQNSQKNRQRWPGIKTAYARVEGPDGNDLADIDICMIEGKPYEGKSTRPVKITTTDRVERWYQPAQAVRVLLALKAQHEASASNGHVPTPLAEEGAVV